MAGTFLKPTLLALAFACGLAFAGILPQTAQAATEDINKLNKWVLVGLPPATLIGMGCVEPTFNGGVFGIDSVTYPDAKPYHVMPADNCSRPDIVACEDVGLFCAADIGTVNPLFEKSKIENAIDDPLTKVIISIMNHILEVVGNAGLWIMEIAGKFMSFMLTQGSYITHPFVRTGWPFLQGIANIGFLLTLLFIAAGTTLQLESWSWYKALPRLLFSALMINFSLVVCGIFIDASRVMMAIMTRVMTGDSISQVAQGIVKNSNLLNGLLDATGAVHAPGNFAWTIPLALLQADILIFAMAIGMALIAVGLVARHIALIILLIFSPLAWLALAFPATKKHAISWWTHFLKWVVYGPILLFFLLLVAAIGTGFSLASLKQSDPAFASILQIGITTALLLFAYKQGKGFAGAAGEGAINFATKWGKAVPGMAYRNPKTAAGLAATVATGGLGGAGLAAGLAAAGGVGLGQKFGRRGLAAVSDFKSKVTKGYEDRTKGTTLDRLWNGPRRNKDGTLQPGETSWGSELGDTATNALNLKKSTTLQAETDARATEGYTKVAALAGITSGDLMRPDFSVNLPPRILQILAESGSKAQKIALGAGLGVAKKPLSKEALDTLIAAATQKDPVTGRPKLDAAGNPIVDTTILKKVVNNVNIVREMKDEQVANTVALDDDKLTATLFKVRAAAQPKDK